MKKILALYFLFISGLVYGQEKSFYLGPSISGGISIPTGDKYYNEAFKSAFAPSAGLLFEIYKPGKLGFQSGYILVDRSSKYEAVLYSFEWYFGRIETFYHECYLAIPALASFNRKHFFIKFGMDFNFPVFQYVINRQPYRSTQFNSDNAFNFLLISAVLKTGWQLPLKNNKLFFELQFDKDILVTKYHNYYRDSRLIIGVGCGYLFGLNKPGPDQLPNK